MRNQGLKPPFLIDIILLSSSLLLSVFSLIMIYSTTGVVALERFGDPYFYVKRQAIAVFIGLLALLLLSKTSINQLRKIAPVCFVLALLLVALTFIPGIGRTGGGAQRWLNLPFISFQPAELAKILFVVFIADYFARKQDKLGALVPAVVIPLFYVALLAALLLKQPDFGSFAIILGVTFIMIVAVGVRLRFFLYGLIPALAGLITLVIVSPYRFRRITAFLHPEEDLQGKGYQLLQSLIAVSTGGFDGVGLGDSMQKLYFLPAAHTDFLFAVISEELGLIGSSALIVFFLVIFWRGFIISKRLIPDLFTYSLAVGLTMLLVGPAFFNMGVVTGLLPTKGLVLPLVGYGGSSMISSLMVVGLLLALARHYYRNAV